MRQQFILAPKVFEQLNELSETLHIPKTSVVTLAIARMHEQLTKTNGKTEDHK